MNHDPQLVALSYFIAALAGYVTLEMASRVRANVKESMTFPWRWVIFGGFTMGTGIWSMHFVGMSAMEMTLSYHAGLTLLSWAAALVAAILALWIIGSGRDSVGWTAMASVVMGLAISAMHYTGMFAIRFSLPMTFDPLLFAASILVAIAASAAALWIAGRLRSTASLGDVMLRVAAALVMGVAVAGMHYTGMAATDIPAGATPAPDNALKGNNMVALTTAGTLILLFLGLILSVLNAREIAHNRRQRQQAEQRVQHLAFNDGDTGLPNRTRFSQHLATATHHAEASGGTFTVCSLRIADEKGEAPQDISTQAATFLTKLLEKHFNGHDIYRRSPHQFAILFLTKEKSMVERQFHAELQAMQSRFQSEFGFKLLSGLAEYPQDAGSGQGLIFHANAHATTA